MPCEPMRRLAPPVSPRPWSSTGAGRETSASTVWWPVPAMLSPGAALTTPQSAHAYDAAYAPVPFRPANPSMTGRISPKKRRPSRKGSRSTREENTAPATRYRRSGKRRRLTRPAEVVKVGRRKRGPLRRIRPGHRLGELVRVEHDEDATDATIFDFDARHVVQPPVDEGQQTGEPVDPADPDRDPDVGRRSPDDPGDEGSDVIGADDRPARRESAPGATCSRASCGS